MTPLEHGLFGGALVLKSNPNFYWWAFAAGTLPDIPLLWAVYKVGPRKVLRSIRTAQVNEFPDSVYKFYYVTHSFVTTAILYGFLYLVHRNLAILAISYGLHILCDIPFHDSRFSTRFLYPLSNFHIHGYSQGRHRWVLLAQYPLIIIIYILLLK